MRGATGAPSYSEAAGHTSGPVAGLPVHVLLNPVSGAGRAARVWARLDAEVRRRFPAGVTVHRMEAPGAARTLADALATTTCLVLAAGGDGTASEVIDGLLASGRRVAPPARFGCLPLGSGNDLAHALGLCRSPDAALAALLDGTERSIDVGILRYRTATGAPRSRAFANSLTLGLGARVIELTHGTGRGRLGYAVAALRAILEARSQRITVTDATGATRWSGPALLAALLNGGAAGAGMRLAPGASVDDGAFDFVALGPIGRVRAMAAFTRVLAGGEPRGRGILRARLAGARIETEGTTPVELDGEQVETSGPLDVTVLHRALCAVVGTRARHGPAPSSAPDPTPLD